MLQQPLPLKQLADEMSATRWNRTLENDVEYLSDANDETRHLAADDKDPKVACLQSRLIQLTCERNAYRNELENAYAEFNTLNVEIKRLVQNYGDLLAFNCDMVSTNVVREQELKKRVVESRVAETKIQSLTSELAITRNKLASASDELMAVCTNRSITSSMSVSEDAVDYASCNHVRTNDADMGICSSRHETNASSKPLNGDLLLKRWNLYANDEDEALKDRDPSQRTKDISKAPNAPGQLPQPQGEQDALQQGLFHESVCCWIQQTRNNDPADGGKELLEQERLMSNLNMQTANLKLTPCGSAREDECNQATQHAHARQKLRLSFISTPRNVKDKDERIQTLQMENEILMKALDRQEADLEANVEKLKFLEDVQVEKDKNILLVEQEILDLKSCTETLKRVEGLVNEKDECIRTLLLENEHLIDELKLQIADLKSHVENLALMEILISQKDESILAVKQEVCDLRNCVESYRKAETFAQKKDECSQTRSLEEQRIEFFQIHTDKLMYFDSAFARKDKHTQAILREHYEEMCDVAKSPESPICKDKAIEGRIFQAQENSNCLLDEEALKNRGRFDEDEMQDVSPSTVQSVIKNLTQVDNFLVAKKEDLELQQATKDIPHLVARTQESSIGGELVPDAFPAKETAIARMDDKVSVSLDLNTNLSFFGNAKDELVLAIDCRLSNGKTGKTKTRKSAPIALKEIDEAESPLESDSDSQLIRKQSAECKYHNTSVQIENINGFPSENRRGNDELDPEKSPCQLENIKTLRRSVSLHGSDFEINHVAPLAQNEFWKKENELLKREIELLRKENDAITSKLLELARQEFQEEEELQSKLATFTHNKSAMSIHCLQNSLNIDNVGAELVTNNQCSSDRQGGAEQLPNIASPKLCNPCCPKYSQLNASFGGTRGQSGGVCKAMNGRGVNGAQKFGEGPFTGKDTWLDLPRTPSKLVQDVLCKGMQNQDVTDAWEAMTASPILPSDDVACLGTDGGSVKCSPDNFKRVYCVMRDTIIKLKQEFAIVSQRSEERLQALLHIEKYFRLKRAQETTETDFDFSQFPVQSDGSVSTIVANITALASSFEDKAIDQNPGPLRSVLETHGCIDHQAQLGKVLPQNDQTSCDLLGVRHEDLHIMKQYPCPSCVESAPSNGEANSNALSKEARWLALLDEKRKDELKILVLDLEVKRLRKIIGMKFRAPKKSKLIMKARTTGFLRMREAKKTVPEIIFFNEFNDSENSDCLNTTTLSFV